MAEAQTTTTQPKLSGKPVQPTGQPTSGANDPQPVFRDWAAI